jgi:hypothetical protein
MLQKWESKWQMAFNADKCFVIRAGTKRKTIKQDYTIHNHILEVVEESKYLGVTINKGNNKITELRTILQRESENS